MQKIVTILFILVFFSSCKDIFVSKNPNVLDANIEANDRAKLYFVAIPQLLDLYEKRDKEYTNYEVKAGGRFFAINWNPKEEILFLSTDVCSWGKAYSGVTKDLLIKVKNETESIEDVSSAQLEITLEKYFKINSENFSLLVTNSCKSWN